MRKIFRVPDEILNDNPKYEGKCGGCNWEHEIFFVVADSQEEANDLWRNSEAGMCADCMIDWFVEASATVEFPSGHSE